MILRDGKYRADDLLSTNPVKKYCMNEFLKKRAQNVPSYHCDLITIEFNISQKNFRVIFNVVRVIKHKHFNYDIA